MKSGEQVNRTCISVCSWEFVLLVGPDHSSTQLSGLFRNAPTFKLSSHQQIRSILDTILTHVLISNSNT